MNNIVRKKRIVIIAGLGILVIVAVAIAVVLINYVSSQRLAQQASAAAYIEIVRALSNGNNQDALDLIDEYAQYLSQQETRDLTARAVVGRDRALAREARDELYAELQAFVKQHNDISALLTARKFLNKLSTSDPDPRTKEVEQLRDSLERKLARDDAYSQLASIVDTNEDKSLKAANDFLKNMALGDLDDRAPEVEHIKDVLETKAQERLEILATLVDAYEQGDFRATADNALLYISYNPGQIDPAVIDMYGEALELWSGQAPDDDLDLQAHLESYERWIVQGAKETEAWIVAELNAGQVQMKLGNYDEAIAAYRTVLTVHPTFTSSAKRLNNLCWYGGLWGYDRDELLGICELGVQGALTSAQLANYRDSRGVVRALRGNFEGAITDFEFFVDVYRAAPDRDQTLVSERLDWLEALTQNKNPFTDEVLTALREDE